MGWLSTVKYPFYPVCINLISIMIIFVDTSTSLDLYSSEISPLTGEKEITSFTTGESRDQLQLSEYFHDNIVANDWQTMAKNVQEIENIFKIPNLKLKVQPHIRITTSSEDYVKDSSGPIISIIFRADNYNLTVDLRQTRDLLATSYVEPHHQPKKGRLSSLPCEWQGTLQGFEDNSIVALSICPVIRGIIIIDNSELMIEAAPGSASPENLHLITSPSEQNLEGKCAVLTQTNTRNNQPQGNRSQQIIDSTLGRTLRLRRQASGNKHGILWTNKQTRFVEIVLVADTSYYRDFGDDVYNRLRATANAVNAIYREIGIVVVLTDIEVWTDYDRTTVSSDVNITLSSFAPYRQKLLKSKRGVSNDNTILVTTADFAGNTVGYAYVGGICTNRMSVATVQDKKKDNIGAFSRTIAHELGHNLGMSHDELGNENCCQERTCIMSGIGSAMTTQKVGWSSCSKELVKKELDSVNYECLRNVPKNLYQKTCGNGVLEAGEQCDCGPPAFCDNRCCDAETCKLAVNATCSHGSCCNTETCHLHQAGRVCRENDGDCDLPEFCSGISEFCPADVYVRDGTPCERDKGYCYKGSCGNPDSRCKKVWDQSASEANPVCLNVNQNGDDDGNCGWEDESRKSFKKCSEIDSSCGTLHCNVGHSVKSRITGKISYVTRRIGSHSCKHIVGNEDIPGNMWLAQDGTPCGKNSEGMCIQQKCRTVVKPDGATECPKNCSGRGVCNNKGNCHCSPGYGPPDCANRGHGGSYDSNYISDRSYEIAIDGLLLFLAIIIPIVAFICCSWEKIRLWWDHSGYSLWSSRCPNCATCLNACCCPCMSKITYWCVTVGHKKETDLNRRELQQVVDDTEASTVCQVMIDMKEQSLTNSWGVADERLFTEVVKITPKNSPDLSRKIVMKSNSPVRHHRSVEDFDRVPPYQHQSVSVDSGCVSDDDVTVHPRVTSQMSMTSLIGVFSRFSNKSVKSKSCKNLNQRQKAFGSQRSIPLSRFVVDPLAGNRRSRKGTPPPNDIRNSFSRSISTDASSSMAMLHQRTTQPSFDALKPHKSDDNIHNISNNTNKNRWSLLGKTSNEYENVQSNQKVHETGHQPEKQPMLPKQTNVGSSKATGPNRPAPPPPPPPKNKLQDHDSNLLGQNKDSVNQKLPSNSKDTITPRRPIMPPKSSLGPSYKSQEDNETMKKAGPQINLEKTPTVSGSPNVKALARKLEKN